MDFGPENFKNSVEDRLDMPTAADLMIKNFISIDVNDTVSDLLGKMGRRKQSYAAVYDKDKYRGFASKKWLLSSRIDASVMKLRNLISHRSKSKTPFFVPKLAPDTDLKKICRLICDADVRALPVVVAQNKKEKVQGVVRAIDVLEELREYYTDVRADEVGTVKLVTIKQDANFRTAIKTMNREGIDRIVIVDNAGKLIGIATLVDFLTKVHVFPRRALRIPQAAGHQGTKKKGYGVGEKHDLLKLPVHNILSHVPNCCTATPESPVNSIIDDMINDDNTSVVLVKDKKPVGIITVKDILDDFARA